MIGVVASSYVEAAAGSAFESAVVATSPSFFVTMQDTSGTTAVDAMGNFDGTYTSGVDLAQSVSLVPNESGRKSVLFDTAGEYLAIPTTIGVYGGAFAIMVAYQYTTASDMPLFRDQTATSTSGTFIADNGSVVTLRRTGGNASTTIAASTLEDGNPHLMILRRKTDSTWTLHFDDGATAAYTSGVRTGNIDMDEFYIGKNGKNTSTQTRPGYYSHAAFWEGELSDTDIAAIFDAWNGV